ncbi:NAD(P)-binding protein [Bacteroidota bacterium]
MIEIIFHGTGGQGVVVAAKLLADAAAKSGYQAQSFAAYGGERRGGKVESFLRISEEAMLVHSKVYEPDYVIIINENLAQDSAIVSGAKDGAGILINSSKPPRSFPLPGNLKIHTIDANLIAAENGVLLPSGLPVVNTTIMGAVAALVPAIGLEELADAIRAGGIPYPEKNIKAAQEAYHKQKAQLSGATTAEPEAEEAPEIVAERYPLYRSKVPPCEANCPAGEPIHTTTLMVQDGKFEEALENIRAENPFPGICGRVCFHPCETDCNRNEFDDGIAANALERAVFEYADADKVNQPTPREKSGKRVAVIGSGPAGMTCAYFLSLLGHEITVFEASPLPGGIPRIGIPEYRLPGDVVDREINQIARLGIDIRTGTSVGKDISFEDIAKEYDACFIAVGAQGAMKLNITGEDSQGVIPGLDFLKGIALGKEPGLGPRVVVIGGGNVAIDAARTARRMGAKEVQIICLESKDIMPAYPEEVEEAEIEGIRILYQTRPVQIHRAGNKVDEIECIKVTGGSRDAKGWLKWPKQSEGTNFTIAADSIIVAIGNIVETPFLPHDVEMSGPIIKVDGLGRTSVPRVYAGGDATTVPGSVVEAISSGKRAATGIDILLTGSDENQIVEGIRKGESGAVSMTKYLMADYTPDSDGLVTFADLNINYFSRSPRVKSSHIPVSNRVSDFREVNTGLLREAAIAEAERCFHCGNCNLCENCYVFCPDIAISLDEETGSLTIDRTICKSCGICIKECPRSAVFWEDGL